MEEVLNQEDKEYDYGMVIISNENTAQSVAGR
jgi:hypothetical protein